MIGAMSGTSADGVDGALVEIDGQGLSMTARCRLHRHVPYPPDVKAAIFSLRQQGQTTPAGLTALGREISLAYAAVAGRILRDAEVPADRIAALAAHGQTLYHAPPDTLQWLDPALIAAKVGCAVVHDFRRADCAAGGQGAPLVPFADYVLFRHDTRHRILLNLGGIANVTILRAGGDLADVVAFDTGPANCIADHLYREAMPDGLGYDEGGKLAGAGKVNRQVVEAFLSDDYFSRPPPKSTDTPAMIFIWEKAGTPVGEMTLQDQLATACRITADSVARAVRDHLPQGQAELILSGGGGNNATLVSMIREQLGDIPIGAPDGMGITGQSKEAVAFALLGAATLDRFPANVPSATGAARPVVLGSITPRP